MQMIDFVREPRQGKLSAIRLVFIVWALVVLAVWAIQSLRGDGLADIPTPVITILGMLLGGKVVQRFAEGSLSGPGSSP